MEVWKDNLKKSVATFFVSFSVCRFPRHTPRLDNLYFLMKRGDKKDKVEPLSERDMQETSLF